MKAFYVLGVTERNTLCRFGYGRGIATREESVLIPVRRCHLFFSAIDL